MILECCNMKDFAIQYGASPYVLEMNTWSQTQLLLWRDFMSVCINRLPFLLILAIAIVEMLLQYIIKGFDTISMTIM